MDNPRPIQHSMTRRSAAHDYTRSGIYHITMHVADGLGQPLGAVVGRLSAPDGSADAPRVALTAAGQMVEHELLTAIHTRYPMVTIQDYVIMPDHLHFLLVVQDLILSNNGKRQPLGQVIAGFKKGCNRKYWEMQDAATRQTQGGTNSGINTGANTGTNTGANAATSDGQTAAHTSGTSIKPAPAAALSGSGIPSDTQSAAGPPSALGRVSSGFPAGYKVPSDATTGRQPLFSAGFCDVMPVDERQLETQRAYIAGNPRNRLLRSITPALHIQRGAITTALTPSALRGYLQRECPPHIATPEALAAIESRLLIKKVSAAASTPTGTPSAAAGTPTGPASAASLGGSAPVGTLSASGAAPAGSAPGGFPAGTKRCIACDAYGDRTLLSARRCLPVVCHRKDAARFEEQKARCLEEAARGTTLVSACISPREREIINECVNRGFPVILIHDNGFADRFHPSADRLALCAEGRLLLITPWSYEYRPKDQDITVPECKAMNCLAQAICRTKDSWWQASNQ